MIPYRGINIKLLAKLITDDAKAKIAGIHAFPTPNDVTVGTAPTAFKNVAAPNKLSVAAPCTAYSGPSQ